MKREGHIYVMFAAGGFALFVYSGMKLLAAWGQFGMSSLVAIVAIVAFVFAGLSAFYLWLAALFSRRAVARISHNHAGWELHPAQHSTFAPLIVKTLRLRRQFGSQFSSDESKPRFSLFLAAGRHWVADSEEFAAAKESGAKC